MSAKPSALSSAAEKDSGGMRVLQNIPAIPAENAGFATPTGPRDGVFVAKPGALDPAESCEQRLTAMIATVNGGRVQEILAVAVRQESGLTPHAGGRPEALDAEARRKAYLLLKLGYSRSLAAAELGVHRSTITRTMARDPEFRGRVLEAEQLAERAPLLCVLEAAQRNWRAAAWLLKHNEAESVKRRKKRQAEREANQSTSDWFHETQAMFDSLKQARQDAPPPEAPRGARRKAKTRRRNAAPQRDGG